MTSSARSLGSFYLGGGHVAGNFYCVAGNGNAANIHDRRTRKDRAGEKGAGLSGWWAVAMEMEVDVDVGQEPLQQPQQEKL